MFEPVSMMRLSAVVLERDERAVLRELGQLGVVQLVRTAAGPDTAPMEPRNRNVELARCDQLLARTGRLRDSLGIAGAPGGKVELPEITLDQADGTLRAMEDRAGELIARRQRLLQRFSELSDILEKVDAYRGVDIPLDRISDFSFVHFVTGSLPEANFEQLRASIGDNVALLSMPGRPGSRQLIAMTSRRCRLSLDDTLQKAGFRPEALPAIKGSSPDMVAGQSQSDREKVGTDLEELNTAIEALAGSFLAPLAEIEQLLNIERRILNAEQNFPRTESAVLLAGWMPAEDTPAVQRTLRTVTGGRCVVTAEVPRDVPDEQVPVLLRHHRLLRPFGMLVAAYGLPKYRELEPALFVAVSYVLMFGMMFGDAGHGAILAVCGLVAMLAGRTANMRDAGLLLLLGGLSSTVFGVIYGSYFGITGLKHHALWHDPIEGNPLTLMFFAIGIGVVMISIGLVLNVVNHLRRGDIVGGILDKFGAVGLLFYWGTLVMVAKYAAIEAHGLLPLAIGLFVALPVLGWVIKEPLEYIRGRRTGQAREPGGIFVAVTESLVGAFEAVLSYLANTISFVRLAAYAMSHAALLMATFMLADEVRRLPFGGPALSVLVIVGGNLLAIALEGLIGAVQALRLEYYEFFGKFFSGSGQAFTPFSLPTLRQPGQAGKAGGIVSTGSVE